MALRSLGSALVAKASPGSVLREKQEERSQGAVAEQAAGAQPQNVVRQTIQEPLEKAAPEGSQKAVSVQPMMQPRTNTSPAMQQKGMEQMGLVPQMGGAAMAASTGRNINAPTGMRSPAAQAVAAPQSGGANIATKLKQTFGEALAPSEVTSYAKGVTAPSAQPTPTPQKVQNAPSRTTYNPIGWLEGTLGGRVSADEPKTNTFDFERNLAQGIAANLGGFIDTAGKFMHNIAPEMNVSENLQKWANSPNNAGIIQNVKSGIQGVSNWIGNAVSGNQNKSSSQPAPKQSTPNPWSNPQPSYAAPKQQTQSKPAPQPQKQNVVQQAVNWLRSLFR